MLAPCPVIGIRCTCSRMLFVVYYGVVQRCVPNRISLVIVKPKEANRGHSLSNDGVNEMSQCKSGRSKILKDNIVTEMHVHTKCINVVIWVYSNFLNNSYQVLDCFLI